MQLISVEKKEKNENHNFQFTYPYAQVWETENDTKRYAQLSAKWPDKTDKTVTKSFQTASSF